MDETTEPVTVDLASWLEAQIAEDEQRAKAIREQDRRWLWRPLDGAVVSEADAWIAGSPDARAYMEDNYGRHIARWDPERVLAECAAKRAILGFCHACDTAQGDAVLRFLAAPYADRPGYPL